MSDANPMPTDGTDINGNPKKPARGSHHFWRLKHEGPLTGDDLFRDRGKDSLSPDDRMLYDIRRLNVIGGGPGRQSSTGQAESVYYLNQYHDPERVLRVWFGANRERLERKGTTKATFDRKLNGQFYDAWRAIEADYGLTWLPGGPQRDQSGNPGPGKSGKTCPRCGEPLGHSLAIHLRQHDGDCLADGDGESDE